MLKVGDLAPDFTLLDSEGREVSLQSLRGRRVVLYFYPKDNTAGCTRQACAFAGAYDAYEKRNIAVVGISRDSAASHKRFKEKYSLPFTLLSDPDHAVTEAYGAWQEKVMCGKRAMGVVRTTYLLDEEGVITHIMPRVKPDTNAEEILALLS